MQNYPASVLEILKKGEKHLEMSLTACDELTQTVRHYSSCPYSSSEINKLCREVTIILNQADKKSQAGPGPLQNLKKLGQLLWDHLFSRQVKERLKTAHHLNLTLMIDEELVFIPWELLYDGKEFLCLSLI